MSKTLTLELPDEIYDAVEQAAEASGKRPAEWVAIRVSQLLSAWENGQEVPQPLPEIDHLLRQVAAEWSRPLEEVRAEWNASVQPKPRPPVAEEEGRRIAREQLRRFAGALNSCDPHSGDNDRIDADLAREYGTAHEEP
jgi:hypothetical protein